MGQWSSFANGIRYLARCNGPPTDFPAMNPSEPAPKRSFRWFALLAVAIGLSLGTRANNIQVANTTLTGNDGTAGTVNVQFDVTWENSWRGISLNNWDAAWVFVKFRTINGLWQHVQLGNTGHTAAAGSTIDPGLLTPGTAFNATTNPVMGVFIYRNANGTGTFAANVTKLNWNYAAQGLSYVDIVDVQVCATEMVYVQPGAFFVGSGGTEFGSFTDGSWTSGNTIPLRITSENALTVAQSAGALWGTSTVASSTVGGAGVLGASFPKGFAAFYCMKYELTQQGYVDFLNTLTYTQQVSRTQFSPSSAAGIKALASNFYRTGIEIQTPGVTPTTPARYACNLDDDNDFGEPVDGKDLACNALKWGDEARFWTGAACAP